MITIPLKLGTFKGPDKGTTRFTEMAVQRILSGVFKDDPFPKSGCTFGDKNCLVGPGCDKAGVCYEIVCQECLPEEQGSSDNATRPDIDPDIIARPSQVPDNVH